MLKNGKFVSDKLQLDNLGKMVVVPGLPLKTA